MKIDRTDATFIAVTLASAFGTSLILVLLLNL